MPHDSNHSFEIQHSDSFRRKILWKEQSYLQDLQSALAWQ